jgi:oxygen-independent coproporphyrinogen-3 oxidase
VQASLYIHVPFCAGVCDYCDFYSVPAGAGEGGTLDQYVETLLGDIDRQFREFTPEHIPTVYIGGGTPSVLGAERMGRLLAGLAVLIAPLGWPDEFTVEANPESADEAFVRTLRQGGVNRISLGIQTFYGPSRQAVHRVGEAALLDERLALAAEYFPGAFSADLITGLPLQTREILLCDIERLLAFRPAHVSLYSLTLEPGTPLAESRALLPPDEQADDIWLAGRDALKQTGYEQYEVSNFALPGKECMHNLRYWHMKNWLGAGPAASATIIDDETGTGRRFTFLSGIDAWLALSRPLPLVEELDRTTLIKESLLMGFRCRAGPDPVLFHRRFGLGIEECIPKALERWYGRDSCPGPLRADDGLKPSGLDLLFLDSFLRDAFAEIDCMRRVHTPSVQQGL